MQYFFCQAKTLVEGKSTATGSSRGKESLDHVLKSILRATILVIGFQARNRAAGLNGLTPQTTRTCGIWSNMEMRRTRQNAVEQQQPLPLRRERIGKHLSFLEPTSTFFFAFVLILQVVLYLVCLAAHQFNVCTHMRLLFGIFDASPQGIGPYQLVLNASVWLSRVLVVVRFPCFL